MRWTLALIATIAAAAVLASRARAASLPSSEPWRGIELPDLSWLDVGIRPSELPPPIFDFSPPTIVDDAMTAIKSTLGLWRPPAKYAGLIAAAEDRHGLPRDMLARLLWQECRWREDIISGRVRSSAGAIGIAQFMPATAAERGIDPLNVPQAIDGAGGYLAGLFKRFGNWSEALAAYNWGQGNVSRKGLGAAPRETRDYYSSILADVNAANGTAWT